MTSIVLFQPAPEGRISGGFLYNARMADAGLWRLQNTAADELPALLSGLREPAVILMDSIWLTPERAPPFLAAMRRGAKLGLMLHSFPSMIEATERGERPRAVPTTFERAMIDELDFVVVPGGHYVAMLAGTSTQLIVSEPGIEDDWRAEPRRRSGPCRLVSVGAVTPRKGFLDVAECLSRFEQRDYTWSIAGKLDVDPGYVQRLRDRTRGLPVELCGQLPPARVRELVQRSDVLLMPSYDENQPLVLLEAMAASVPAVAYAAGAARTMVEHGREGFITEIGDRETFAEHLRRLMADEDHRHQLAVACWNRQASLPSWTSAAGKARADIERLLS